MSTKTNSTSAFPVPGLWRIREFLGMRLREYAAIWLRVPDSGIPWLDKMILTSKREDIAANVVSEFIRGARDTEMDRFVAGRQAIVDEAYLWADTMLAGRSES